MIRFLLIILIVFNFQITANERMSFRQSVSRNLLHKKTESRLENESNRLKNGFPIKTFGNDSEKTSIKSSKSISSKIITSEMLHKAGILNIGDIFLLANGTYTSTIEGNNLYINQGLLSPFQEQKSIILVDGIRCDINVFRNQNTHVLPITIEQVDYIEFIDTPGIIEGEFNSNGIIHIHTKKPPENLTVRLGYNIGNEIGDPGPIKYIDERSENVDKLPMNFNFNVNYKGEKGYFIGTVKSMEGFATDNSIKRRINQLTNENKKFNLIAASFKLRYTDIGEYQDFFFGYSENQNYFFLAPYGNELPLKHSYRQYGLNGLFKLDENISLKYLLIRNENLTSDWNSRYNHNFDWQFEKTTARVSSSYYSELFGFNFGLEYSNLKGVTDQKLNKDEFSSKKFFANFSLQTTKEVRNSIGIELTDVWDDNSVNIYNHNSWNLSNNEVISSNFAYSKSLLSKANSYWKWHNEGYDFFNDKIKLNGDINSSLGEKLTAELTYSNQLNKIFGFSLSGRLTHFFNYTIFSNQFYFEEQNDLFNSPTEISNSESLKNLRFVIQANHKTSLFLSQSIYLSYQKKLDGTKYFSDQWKIFPEINAIYEIDYHPHPTFSVWCQINYQSESVWTDYYYVQEQSDNFYNNRIDDKILINLSFQKWFWQKRIWFNISFRNILNETERYYPIGAEFNLRFYTQIKVYLNSVLD